MSEIPSLRFPDADGTNQRIVDLLASLRNSPIPDHDLLANLLLYFPAYSIRRFLYLSDLYRQILDVPGYVADFGTRYGFNLILFRQLWHIFEPGNVTRAFFGFDTFQGLTKPETKDGDANCSREGHYSVPADYSAHLKKLIGLHEQLEHKVSAHPMTRTFVVEGDASSTFEQFIEANPHSIFALAYFDFDLYKPTLECLKLLSTRLVKGSVVAFDELIVSEFPGETAAVMETFRLCNIRLRRYPYSHCWSYFIME